MDFSFYSIQPETVMKWILIGFAFAFFIKDFQTKIQQVNLTVKAATSIAITLSIIALFLLVEGFDTTVIALLGFGGGVVLHLVTAAIYHHISHKPKELPKPQLPNSNTATSHISAPNHSP